LNRKDWPDFANDGEKLTFLLKIFRQEKHYALYKARQSREAKDSTQYNYWRGVYSTACSAYDFISAMHEPKPIEVPVKRKLRTILMYMIAFGKELIIGTVSDYMRR
jgi:hypothetical protein